MVGRVKQQAGVGGHGEPDILFQFVLQLAGGPAGITQCNQYAAGAAATGNVGEDVGGGGQQDIAAELD